MRILILAGGNSSERKVSEKSGFLVAKALQKNGHAVCLADPCADVKLSAKKIKNLYSKSKIQPLKPLLGRKKKTFGNGFIELAKSANLVFLALHGGFGEDGRLQALLECYGIPFTGSGSMGSMIAMDKDLSKRLFKDAGLNTPEWMIFEKSALSDWKYYPCVVKPNAEGSSIGVRFVDSKEDLLSIMKDSRKQEKWIVERKIDGREFSVGVLKDTVLPAVEILPQSGFYDYKNKYNGTTREVCPANLNEKEEALLEESAKAAFSALHLQGYARIDFLLDRNGTFWCLEANTLPGMTEQSLLPKEALARGIKYEELCEKILESAKKNDWNS